jgi:hypothetical protein
MLSGLVNLAALLVRLPSRVELFGNRPLLARVLWVPILFVACATFFFVFWGPITLLLYVLHTRRPLSASEQVALGPRFAHVFVVERPSPAMRVFFGGAAACAIDNGIYVFAPVAKKLSVELLRHECVHVLQYCEEGGFVPFLGLYFAFTLYDLVASRCDGAKAYKKNPFEMDARKRERKDSFARRLSDHEQLTQ